MRRVVIAGMIGNGLEWYDFALYGYLAPVIGRLFFPGHDPDAQMLSVYGVFAAGFIARPIGAILFGYLGDKFGRKFSLTLSMFMMAVPTACISLLPTYAQIGIYAPILLTVIRLLQGLSLAGQFTGSITFIVEHTAVGRRGLAGSMTVISLCVGMMCGSLIATVLTETMNQQNFLSWGWRLPFVLGLVIAGVGYYIRHNTDESPHYEKARGEGRLSKTPVREALKGHWIELLRGIGIYLSVTVPFYTVTVFLSGFMSNGLGFSLRNTYIIDTISMVLMIALLPCTAKLTDVYGRKFVLMWTCVAYFFGILPIILLLSHPTFAMVLTGTILFTIVLSFFISSVPTLLVELFPTTVRYTGMSIAYNIAAVLGGMTPVIEKWLVVNTRFQTVSIIYGYVVLCALGAFAALMAGRKFNIAGIRLCYALLLLAGGGALYYGSLSFPGEYLNTIAVALFIMLCSVISFVSFFKYHDSYNEELA